MRILDREVSMTDSRSYIVHGGCVIIYLLIHLLTTIISSSHWDFSCYSFICKGSLFIPSSYFLSSLVGTIFQRSDTHEHDDYRLSQWPSYYLHKPYFCQAPSFIPSYTHGKSRSIVTHYSLLDWRLNTIYRFIYPILSHETWLSLFLQFNGGRTFNVSPG